MITGPGPSDRVAREAWLAAGYRPYSFHRSLGEDENGNRTVEAMMGYKQLEPIAFPIALLATGAEKMRWADIDDFGEDGSDDALIGEYAEAVVKTFTSATFDRSVLKNLVDTVDAFTDQSVNAENKWQKLAAYNIAKFVPNLARDVAGWVTPEDRKGVVLETRDTVLDVALGKIPFLNQQFEIERNRWGDSIMKDKVNFLGAISPVKISTPAVNSFFTSPIDREILRLGVEGVDRNGQKERYPDAILQMPPRRLTTKAGAIKLSSPQYVRYLEIENSVKAPNPETGEPMTLRDNLNYLVTQSPVYKNALPESQAFLIKQWSNMGYGALARDQMFKEFPELQEKFAKKLGFKADKSVGILGTEADQSTTKQSILEAVKQNWAEQEGVLQ
jgi:hypothetical protein